MRGKRKKILGKGAGVLLLGMSSAFYMLSFFSILCFANDYEHAKEKTLLVKSRTLAQLSQGMAEVDVINLLGTPDEVRFFSNNGSAVIS